MMYYGYAPFGGFGWIFMILWWAVIIAIIFAFTKWLTSQSRSDKDDHEKTPLDILKNAMQRGRSTKRSLLKKRRI